MLLTDTVHIWRAPEGDYHIEWQASQPDTRVWVEVLGDDVTFEAYYADTAEFRARISGLPLTRRHFFRVRDEHGNEVLAPERRLGLSGAPNFRDFGGYTTADGSRVKWGYLFRSGHLAELSESDVALLASLDLDLVFDFRQVPEQRREPSRLPLDNPPKVVSLPIQPGNNSGVLEQFDGPLPGPEVMFDFMISVNRDLAQQEAPSYHRMFAEILGCDDARFLVHCAAGKDRTGFAAAMMLMALGVPETTVLDDYLLTTRFYDARIHVERVKGKYGLSASDSAAVLPMLQVNEAFFRGALKAIHEQFEDVDSYLEEALGLGAPERAELRRRYLQ